VGLVLWPFQALSIKRGWFERPDPDPSGKPIRRTSDRGLRWFILVGGVAVISLAHSLLAGEGSAVVPAVLIGTMLPLTFLVWRELRRRKRTGGWDVRTTAPPRSRPDEQASGGRGRPDVAV